MSTKNYIKLSTIRNMASVIYAKSDDATRLNVNTIHIDAENIVATDGHRLSMIPHKEAFFKNLEMPISIRMDKKETTLFLNRLKELKHNGSDFEVAIELTDRYFTMLDYVFALYPSGFPRYEAIIPKKTAMLVGFNREYLIEALKNTKGKNVKLGLNSDLSPCSIVSTDPEHINHVNILMPVKL